MTEPAIDKVLRHVSRAIVQARSSRVHVWVRKALQGSLTAIWAQKDAQMTKRRKRK